MGKTAPGLKPDVVIGGQERADQWTKNTNSCGIKDEANPPVDYKGTTTKGCERRRECHRLGRHEGRADLLRSARLHRYVVRQQQVADRVGHPLQHPTSGRRTGVRRLHRSVAAPEIGLTLQFDHVDGDAKGDEDALMWPYLDSGDTSGRNLGRGEAMENNSNY